MALGLFNFDLVLFSLFHGPFPLSSPLPCAPNICAFPCPLWLEPLCHRGAQISLEGEAFSSTLPEDSIPAFPLSSYTSPMWCIFACLRALNYKLHEKEGFASVTSLAPMAHSRHSVNCRQGRLNSCPSQNSLLRADREHIPSLWPIGSSGAVVVGELVPEGAECPAHRSWGRGACRRSASLPFPPLHLFTCTRLLELGSVEAWECCPMEKHSVWMFCQLCFNFLKIQMSSFYQF